MANITIQELRPAGSELFQDSESFLNELTGREMLGIAGGYFFYIRTNANTVNNTVGNTRRNDYNTGSYSKVGC